MLPSDLPAVAGGVVVIGGAVAALAKGVRWVRTLLRRVNDFLEDWNGEAARPGVKARPGVMTRLDAIEYQLNPNGGRSMHDKVIRIEHATGAEQ